MQLKKYIFSVLFVMKNSCKRKVCLREKPGSSLMHPPISPNKVSQEYKVLKDAI